MLEHTIPKIPRWPASRRKLLIRSRDNWFSAPEFLLERFGDIFQLSIAKQFQYHYATNNSEEAGNKTLQEYAPESVNVENVHKNIKWLICYKSHYDARHEYLSERGENWTRKAGKFACERNPVQKRVNDRPDAKGKGQNEHCGTRNLLNTQ